MQASGFSLKYFWCNRWLWKTDGNCYSVLLMNVIER